MSILTPKQEKFCQVYLATGNATEAYRQAYDVSGMQPQTINVKASELLANGKIGVRLQELNQAAVSAAVMTRQEALERLSMHARIKITDICTFKLVEVDLGDGEMAFNTIWEMKNAEEIPPDVAACIKSVTFTKSGPKIELYDANGSIQLLAKMQGWESAQKLDLASTDGSMSPKPIDASKLSQSVLAELMAAKNAAEQ